MRGMNPLSTRSLDGVPPGLALLPLRLFLGATFAYAGVQKLSDPGFLRPGSATYIGTQLDGFAHGTPAAPLLELVAIPHPQAAGVGVAVLEIAVGLLTVSGRLTRAAAAVGLGLSVTLFLSASWHTSPYFLGSDIAFAFAWLPFVLAGAAGQPALDHRRPRRISLRRRGHVHIPVPAEALTRRAAIARGLAGATAATAALAGLATLLRGSAPAAGRAGGVRAPRKGVMAASALPRGQARPFTGPDGSPALLVRTGGGELVALGARCTHAGCTVEWRGHRIECPCHGARYDPRTGAPTRGPAREPLPRLAVHERDGQIYVS